MIDFDLTEFSNCDAAKRSRIQSIIAAAQIEDNKLRVIDYAKRCLELVAPNKNMNTLLSSLKDFGKLDYTEDEVRAGVHVIRGFFAHKIHQLRKATSINSYSIDITDISNHFDIDGIVAVDDFLPEEILSQVVEELEHVGYAVSKNKDNIISNMSNTKFPALKGVLVNSYMKELVFGLLGYPTTDQEVNVFYESNTFAQKLNIQPGDGDVQKVLHLDTFFPCIKWWYFPHAIDIDGGPFSYVRTSNQFSHKMAKFIYDQSIEIVMVNIDPERTYGHREGSFRIFSEELDDMGLVETPYTVRANTIVLANVCGFHRRREVLNEVKRNSIHGSIRVLFPFT